MAMDFMAGPAAPPGPPVDLAAALGAPGPPGPQAPAGPASEPEALDAIMAACDAYLGIETVDDNERLTIEKIKTMVQQLHAANEKNADQTMGTSPALRKALSGA